MCSMDRKNISGMHVDYYEMTNSRLIGPYPAIITSYNTKTQLSSLRVMLLDDYCTADVKNVPQWQPGTVMPERYWRSEQINAEISESPDRFNRITRMLNTKVKAIKSKKKSYVSGTDIQIRHGAFIEILDKNGQRSKQIYISKDTKISILIPGRTK